MTLVGSCTICNLDSWRITLGKLFSSSSFRADLQINLLQPDHSEEGENFVCRYFSFLTISSNFRVWIVNHLRQCAHLKLRTILKLPSRIGSGSGSKNGEKNVLHFFWTLPKEGMRRRKVWKYGCCEHFQFGGRLKGRCSSREQGFQLKCSVWQSRHYRLRNEN